MLVKPTVTAIKMNSIKGVDVYLMYFLIENKRICYLFFRPSLKLKNFIASKQSSIVVNFLHSKFAD